MPHNIHTIRMLLPFRMARVNCYLVQGDNGHVLIDTGSSDFRRQYGMMGAQRRDKLRRLFRSMDVDHIEVMTGRDYLHDLIRFFKMRERRSAG